jgi:ABC-2 type transport system permease protein
MNTLYKLSWVELKLFIREPITMVFTFVLPILFLLIMGEVFGNTPDTGDEGIVAWRGFGPMNVYTPSYIGLVMAAIGLFSIPVHLTAYREQGVLRRLHATSISTWALFGSQLIVSFVLIVVCSLILVALAFPIYDVMTPESMPLLVLAFLVSTVTFAAIGILLGSLLPTSRAAQGIGLLLFFLMLMLSGAGPPVEVMSDPMIYISDAMPLTHINILLQDAWLGFGWNWFKFAIAIAFSMGATTIAYRFFRWE